MNRAIIDLQVRADTLAGKLHSAGDTEGAALIYELRTALHDAHKRIERIRLLI